MSKNQIRVFSIVLIALFVLALSLNSLVQSNEPPQDLNVYLNEEIRFSDEIFIKVVGLSVDITENDFETVDEDGDVLSEYTLNLLVSIEQRNTDFWVNMITMKSEMFTLKSVNLESKSKMQIFFSTLATVTLQTSLSILAGVAVEGALEYGVMNAIETGVDFAEEYLDQSIENAETLTSGFKPIKATKNQFSEFKPRENMNEETIVKLSFPIKQEYLESENVMVLTVDKIDKWEKRMFLMPRP